MQDDINSFFFSKKVQGVEDGLLSMAAMMRHIHAAVMMCLHVSDATNQQIRFKKGIT